MLVVSCRNPNSAERELIEALMPLDGVAFIGYVVTNGNREREIDALLLTPVRATAIEVKAPKLATANEGELKPRLNGPWTIGDEQAQFYGDKAPHDQARTAAQMVATMLREKQVPKTPFVQSAVAVAGRELTMDAPVMLGQTAVGLTKAVLPTLELMKQKPITLDMAMNFVKALDLGPLAPRRQALAKEWANADTHHRAIPRPPQTRAIEAVTKPLPPDEHKTKFQRAITLLADNVALFVVMFLVVHFLDSYGVFDGLLAGLSWLFQWIPGVDGGPFVN